MLDRFPDPRKIMDLAREAAARQGDSFIAPEHLFLAVIREGSGPAAVVLRQLGLDLVKLERAILAERSSFGVALRADKALPFTPEAKSALEGSVAAASRFGHNSIGTEHVLLGVVSVPGAIPVRVLKKLGVGVEDVRIAVAKVVGSGAATANQAPLRVDVGALDERTDAFVTKLASTDVAVLVRAPSAAARIEIVTQLHLHGPRRHKNLMTINAATLDEGDFESVLLRPTDAPPRESDAGLLDTARGGILFLDQIDALPLVLQERLAAVLEDPKSALRMADVRVVSGTALDLRVLFEQKKFSPALLVRITGALVDVTRRNEAEGDRLLATANFNQPKSHCPPGARPTPEHDRTRPLFDRLSRRSDRVLEAAREEARRLRHGDVGAEHLLLGIAREGSGLAAIVLLELLSDLGKIAPAVASAREPGAPPVALGFASSAQAALDTADEVAQDLERDTVDPEHILIGIARDAEGSGAILRTLGLDPATVEARLRVRLAAV